MVEEFQDIRERVEGSPAIAALGVSNGIYWSEKYSLLIISLKGSPSEKEDESLLQDILQDSFFQEKHRASLLLYFWRSHDEVRAVAESSTSRVRAIEFMQVLLSEAGLTKGGPERATGRITAANLWIHIEELNLKDLNDYFMKMSVSYFEDCDEIDAAEYAPLHEAELKSLPKYVKAKIPWSFVKSTDIAPAGSLLSIKSLENESGMEVPSDPDTYVMIGSQGEVYHINREKFEKSYEATDEPLDIFSQMTVFLPEVRVLPDGDFISIDEMANICYPKQGMAIYARPLSKRTKIYPVYDKEHYFLGRAGDYMAIRSDDISDMYIIQKKIFLHTYEEA